MRAVTIKQAKATLNELVDAASSGEHVVLLRGSTHVAAIVPISADELEIAPRLGDEQAARFWRLLGDEARKPGTLVVESPAAAVEHLSRGRSVRRARRVRKR